MTARFFQQSYPSANSVLLPGPRPVLVDSGFGPAVPSLLAWLAAEGVAPGELRVLNTHWHSDHVGGNHALQQRGATILAERTEAARVNARDPDACQGVWLRQEIEPYTVDQPIQDGDRIDTGQTVWTVIASPGHTAGHLSLWDGRVLVLGDAMHAADVGWLNLFKEGPDSLERTADTIERLAGLPAAIGYSGHGAAVQDLPAAFARARRRIAAWRAQPDAVAWHACKRVFSHMLMLTGGLPEPEIAPALLDAPWFQDHARLLGVTPALFVGHLVAESVRADAARWRDGRLLATAPHAVPPAGWAAAPTHVADWP